MLTVSCPPRGPTLLKHYKPYIYDKVIRKSILGSTSHVHTSSDSSDLFGVVRSGPAGGVTLSLSSRLLIVLVTSWYAAIDSDRTYRMRVTEYNTACFVEGGEFKTHVLFFNNKKNTAHLVGTLWWPSAIVLHPCCAACLLLDPADPLPSGHPAKF